jgi:hypothetical protein
MARFRDAAAWVEMWRISSMKRTMKIDLHNYNVGPKDSKQESRKTAGQMVRCLQDD